MLAGNGKQLILLEWPNAGVIIIELKLLVLLLSHDGRV